jgi:hypothetical protein
MDRSARNDFIAALSMLAIAAIFAPATAHIFIDPLDPGFSARDFPIGVLSLMTVLAGAMLVRSLPRLARSGWRLYEANEARPLVQYLLPMVALGFLYIWLMDMFQYLLPTFLALAAAMAIFGNRGFARLVATPFVVASAFYVLFYGVFGLSEPAGTVWSYDNQWYFRPFRAFIGMS